MFFIKISFGGISRYMKPMPVIFLFSSAHDPLSNMFNFHWDPSMIRKLANFTKNYTISATPTILH